MKLQKMESEKTLEFIHYVEEIPLLWKKEDPDFANRERRKRAFDDLSHSTGISVGECKKKLKNLKDRMRDICSKLPKNRHGHPAFDVGEQLVSWPYYKPLLFMQDQFMARHGLNDPDLGSMQFDDSATEGGAIDAKDLLSNCDVLEQFPASIAGNSQWTPNASSKYSSKRRRVDEDLILFEREKLMDSVLNKALDSLHQHHQDKQDEWLSYTSSLCCDLRKIKDPHLAMKVKMDINRLVHEAVIDQLQKDTSSLTTCD